VTRGGGLGLRGFHQVFPWSAVRTLGALIEGLAISSASIPPSIPGRVSVVIVNFNGYEYARRCVASVLLNHYDDYEVIVVDNGSADDSVAKLRAEFKNENLNVVPLSRNFGPSAARNAALPYTSGEFLAFLDNDTVPDPDWLLYAVRRLQADQGIATIQSRLMLLREPTKFDYAGDYLGSFGFLIQPVKVGEVDIGQANDERIILSAKSAGMVARRSAFLEAGAFDGDYFIYMEETDLGLRLWLLGYQNVYIPESLVFHEFGTSSIVLGDRQNALAKFHGPKNYVLTLAKTLEGATLLRILPIHVILWIAYAFLNLVAGRTESAGLIIKGLFWNVRKLRSTLEKRRKIQESRRVSDRFILGQVGRKDSIVGLFKKARQPQAVGNYRPSRR